VNLHETAQDCTGRILRSSTGFVSADKTAVLNNGHDRIDLRTADFLRLFAVQREKSLSLAELTRQTAFAAAQGGLQLHT